MKIILYAYDYEPITVLDMDESIDRFLRDRPRFWVAFDSYYSNAQFRNVEIHGLQVRNHLRNRFSTIGDDWIMIIPNRDESAYIVSLFIEPTESYSYSFRTPDTKRINARSKFSNLMNSTTFK